MADDGITRTDAAALFAEEVAPQVIEKAIESSVALSDFPRMDMGQKVTRLPILATLPTGGFLATDQTAKAESEFAWAEKSIEAEEVAVIVPISESVIADASIDVVAKTVELIGQEFGRVIDDAVFFGTNKPATWPDGLFDQAVTASQSIEAVTDPAIDFNALFKFIEDLNYDVTNVYGARSIKAALRAQTAALSGAAIYNPADGGNAFGSIYGAPLGFPLAWDATDADAIAVDKSMIMMGIRQDITIKLLDQATLTTFGNLAERDSVAVRAVMRVGFQTADPINVVTGARDVPISALTPDVT